jgi:peptidoglycan/xylan/chitin deacetylase (PgdA/CDA1 family)
MAWMTFAGFLFFSFAGCQGGYFKAQTGQKMIALTFDDGPNPTYTPQVLKILNDHQVKATFFLIGQQAQAYPELVQQIKTLGHGLGNHSFSHPFNLSYLSRDKMRQEITATQQVLFSITGEAPRLFRPPLGWVSRELEAVCHDLSLPIINGSIKAGDVSLPGREYIISAVLDWVRAGDIIILHDGGGFGFFRDRTQTLQALPVILETLKERGYRFVTVSELLSGPS